MVTLIQNLLADFGAEFQDGLTVGVVVVMFAFVLALDFIADLIHSLMMFGRRIR